AHVRRARRLDAADALVDVRDEGAVRVEDEALERRRKHLRADVLVGADELAARRIDLLLGGRRFLPVGIVNGIGIGCASQRSNSRNTEGEGEGEGSEGELQSAGCMTL